MPCWKVSIQPELGRLPMSGMGSLFKTSVLGSQSKKQESCMEDLLCRGSSVLRSLLEDYKLGLFSLMLLPQALGKNLLCICHSFVESLLLDQRNCFPMNILLQPICSCERFSYSL